MQGLSSPTSKRVGVSASPDRTSVLRSLLAPPAHRTPLSLNSIEEVVLDSWAGNPIAPARRLAGAWFGVFYIEKFESVEFEEGIKLIEGALNFQGQEFIRQ